MKKFLSIIITIAVLLSALTVSICAINIELTTTPIMIGNRIVLANTDALESVTNITEEEAGYVAGFFVDDMIQLDECEWNENTTIVDVVTMYDETGILPTAYTIELTSGYVVVSAFADYKSLILEYSDTGEPIYDVFDTESQIVYLGGYEYYNRLANSDLVGLSGTVIESDSLINKIDLGRSPENLPTELLEYCMYSAPGYDFPPGKYPILDPFSHAQSLYGGTFVCADYHNEWEDYVSFFTAEYGYQGYMNWAGCCGPVAITNLILAFENRYRSLEDRTWATEIMDTVALYGADNNYYDNNIYGGTDNETARNYIYGALALFDINVATAGWYSNTYSNIKNWLSSGCLLYMVVENPTYEYHVVMCYAYTHLVNTTNTASMTFVKVADGLCVGGRYIDVSTISDDTSREFFHAVDMW